MTKFSLTEDNMNQAQLDLYRSHREVDLLLSKHRAETTDTLLIAALDRALADNVTTATKLIFKAASADNQITYWQISSDIAHGFAEWAAHNS